RPPPPHPDDRPPDRDRGAPRRTRGLRLVAPPPERPAVVLDRRRALGRHLVAPPRPHPRPPPPGRLAAPLLPGPPRVDAGVRPVGGANARPLAAARVRRHSDRPLAGALTVRSPGRVDGGA